jgi:hypothetical protein
MSSLAAAQPGADRTMRADASPLTMHCRQAQKSLIPYSVFDEPRVLQTALQSLHGAMCPAG